MTDKTKARLWRYGYLLGYSHGWNDHRASRQYGEGRSPVTVEAGVIVSEPDWRMEAGRLAEALRLTQEYVGSEVLPPIEGWSWFDGLNRYDGLVG